MAATDPDYYHLRSRPVLKRSITNKEGKNDTKEAINDLDLKSNDAKLARLISTLQEVYEVLFPKQKTNDEPSDGEEKEEERDEEEQDQTITIRFTVKNIIT